METRANYILVGLFTLITIILACVFVFLSFGIGNKVKETSYEVLFTFEVPGLQESSPVTFKGIKVGHVTNIYIDPDNNIVANIVVTATTPIYQNSIINLGFKGITGVAAIVISDGGAEKIPVKTNDGVRQLLARRSALSSSIDQLPIILDDIRDILPQIQYLLRDQNQKIVTNILLNLEKGTNNFGKHSKQIQNILANLENSSAVLRNGLPKIIASFDKITKNFDKSSQDVNKFIQQNSLDITLTIQTARKTLNEFSTFIHNLGMDSNSFIFNKATGKTVR